MKWSARLSLESLDGRIVPSGTPLDAPPDQTTPVTTAPPAPARPIAEIQADITAITAVITQTKTNLTAGIQKEKALAVDVVAAKIGFEEAGKVAIAVSDNPNATTQQKLQALLLAFEAGTKYGNARAALATQQAADASLMQNLIGLNAMLASLQAELAAAQGTPPPVGTEEDLSEFTSSVDEAELAVDSETVDDLAQAWADLGAGDPNFTIDPEAADEAAQAWAALGYSAV